MQQRLKIPEEQGLLQVQVACGKSSLLVTLWLTTGFHLMYLLTLYNFLVLKFWHFNDLSKEENKELKWQFGF